MINFVDGGGGLEGFAITGGDAGVVVRGISDDSITIKDMNLGHTGRGILHLAPSNLTVEGSSIHDCSWNGISFAPKNLDLVSFIPQAVIMGSTLIDGENIGIYVSHGGFEVVKAALGGWSGGAIAVDNGSSALVVDSYLIQNRKFGILFFESSGSVLDTTILNTLAAAGLLGDGVTVWCSSVLLSGLTIENSERASVSNFGGHVDLQDSELICDSFNIGVEAWTSCSSGGQPSFYCGEDPDCPSVRCGCPLATERCLAQGYALQPPPPSGGLE